MRRVSLFLVFIPFLSCFGCSHNNSRLSTISTTAAETLSSEPVPEPAPKPEATITTEHEPFIRQAFDLAIRSGKQGNHTFGALLVNQGKVILTAENTVNTDNDPANHAEKNLLVKARRELSPEVLRQSTLYTSTAPCMFCCAAMWYRGVNKVVFGVSHEAFATLTGQKDKDISCDKLYRETGKTLEWIGPVLEEEGLKAFCHWPQDAWRPLLLKKLDGCKTEGRS